MVAELINQNIVILKTKSLKMSLFCYSNGSTSNATLLGRVPPGWDALCQRGRLPSRTKCASGASYAPGIH